MKRISVVLALIVVSLITVWIYWPALHGPFVFDDVANLQPLVGWLHGWYGWRFVVFGNDSGLLGRPLSMATFLADAAISHSTGSFAFKLTNLGTHLATGLAMFWLALRVFRRWQPTQHCAAWFALALVAWWLWLPLNVDTVLYTVQRMAQLAALFMLLALSCYMAARKRIDAHQRGGYRLLWIGVPVLTALAAFSKENGLLALPLALVLEWFLYANPGDRRPVAIKWFFVLTVGVPMLAGIVYVIWRPQFILGGYAGRPFTLIERLQTEPRVLWSYVQTVLVPLGPRMGFFQDNFPISMSLARPWTTLPAILAWVVLVVTSFLWRRRNPLFGTGVLFFLVGQAMESSVFPLELYFEHRNYLPSCGVLLAAFGLLMWVWRRIPAPSAAFRRITLGLVGLALALLATTTWSHAQSWRTTRDFYAAQLAYNPTSRRLQSGLAQQAFAVGNLPAALAHISMAEKSTQPSELATVTLWRFLAYCSAKQAPPGALYTQLATRAHGRITQDAMTAFALLANDVDAGCPDIDVARLARIMQQWVAQPTTPPRSAAGWRTRYNLAAILARGGQLGAARNAAQLAWTDSGHNAAPGVLLFSLNASLGDVAACQRTLAQLERSARPDDYRLREAIAGFKNALASGKIGAAPAATTSPPPSK